MSTKYHIKYEKYEKEKYLMVGGMDNTLVPGFVKEINNINSHIKSLYSHGDIIVLSGSGALLYYLHSLGFTDLIDEIAEPNDVDFLLLTNQPNGTITVPFIGDHKRKQVTHEKSATFENNWAPHLKFKSFDLTIPRNSINYNQVGQVNLLSLTQLKSYYMDDMDIRDEDKLKISIIDKTISRLTSNPRPDIIGPEETFRIGKNKPTQIPINYQETSNFSQVLFPDTPSTPVRIDNVRTNLLETPNSKPVGKILFPDSP